MNETAVDNSLNKGIAYHEAGHAVLAHKFGYKNIHISILETKEFGGCSISEGENQFVLQQRGVYYLGTVERHRHLCHRIMILMAGEVAQREFCRESVKDFHAAYDRNNAERLIKELDPFDSAYERQAAREALYMHTRQLIDSPLIVATIDVVAQALLERKDFIGDAAHKLVRSAMEEAMEIECPHCAEWEYRDDDE